MKTIEEHMWSIMQEMQTLEMEYLYLSELRMKGYVYMPDEFTDNVVPFEGRSK